jgi:redox-sensitive bicupin YhaK (pirin superfamily)
MNWMIAGSGITHSERFKQALREGGPISCDPIWVALPNGQEETAPALRIMRGRILPVYVTVASGCVCSLAGEACGLRAAVKTHSPLF